MIDLEHLKRGGPLVSSQIDRVIKGDMTPVEVADTCEALGELAAALAKVETVLILVAETHRVPLAREGALEGLARIIDRPSAREAIERMAKNDQSKILRELAREILENEGV